MALLTGKGVVVGFNRPLLGPIDFSILHGITAVTGRNGVGKSALIQALLGDATLLKGEIYWEGVATSVEKIPPSQLSQLAAYVPQQASFPEHFPVSQFLRISNPIDPHSQLWQSVVGGLGLTAFLNRRLGQLSGGERQIALVARALLQPARAALLDEPSTFLDSEFLERLVGTLKELYNRYGKSTLVTTHEPRLIEGTKAHLFPLTGGKAADSTPAT